MALSSPNAARRRARSFSMAFTPMLECLEDRTLLSGFLAIPNPEPGPSELFGSQIAAHGSMIAVSDPADDTGGVYGAGSVHVFDRGSGSPLYTIPNPAPAFPDQFGTALTTLGDSLVIGADSDNGLAGSVRVYDWATGQLRFELQNPSPFAPNRFGVRVVPFGTDLLVSARGESSQVGALYLFSGSTGAYMRTFPDPDQTVNGSFVAYAAFGDNIFVGGGPQGSEKVYVISGTTGQTLQTIPVHASEIFVAGDKVALDGTPWNQPLTVYDAATVTPLYTLPVAPGTYLTGGGVLGSGPVFSASAVDGGAQGAGEAYLYDADTGTLLQAIPNPEPEAGARFGYVPVFIDGDLVVGAPLDDVGGVPDAGTVYIIHLQEQVQTVQIDIKPGDRTNPINLANQGVIPVAILGSAAFDVSQVDATSVIFADAHAVQRALEDVNGDGILDMILHFRTQDTNLRATYEALLAAADTTTDGRLDRAVSAHQGATLTLSGRTRSGQEFASSDTADLFLAGAALKDFLAILAGRGEI